MATPSSPPSPPGASTSSVWCTSVVDRRRCSALAHAVDVSQEQIARLAYVPELMTSVSNGVGATTTITYDRLNQNGSFYSKATGVTYPTQSFDGPVYVVSQIGTSNGIARGPALYRSSGNGAS